MNAKLSPGRPRQFDAEAALAVGQAMFHAHGYDGVGLAALTERLDIRPPSFYAAFGNKAAFFARVLDRYATSELPLATFLRPGRHPGEALSDLLESAARTYGANPEARGCLVLEAVRSGGNEDAVALARQVAERRRAQIRAFVATTHPQTAEAVRDAVTITMSGLSAGAREGWETDRLLTAARIAAAGVRHILADPGL